MAVLTDPDLSVTTIRAKSYGASLRAKSLFRTAKLDLLRRGQFGNRPLQWGFGRISHAVCAMVKKPNAIRQGIDLDYVWR